MSVNPKVIETPSSAIAKNGIELRAKAKSHRAREYRPPGRRRGRTDHYRARGEGIVTTIGFFESHEVVLENLTQSQNRSGQGLRPARPLRFCPSTSPTWTSAAISARSFQTDQAEADKRIAQAKAEEAPRHGRRPRTGDEGGRKRWAKVVEAEPRCRAPWRRPCAKGVITTTCRTSLPTRRWRDRRPENAQDKRDM